MKDVMDKTSAMKILEDDLCKRGVALQVFNDEQRKQALDIIAGVVVEAYTEGMLLGEYMAKLQLTSLLQASEQEDVGANTGYLQ